jgi:hypothetical protein
MTSSAHGLQLIHKITDTAGLSAQGISKSSLWDAWKAMRKDIRKASIRDVIDFLDYDVDPDEWIDRLLANLSSGTYEPAPPARFYLGKSSGLSRTMTMRAIPDLALYSHDRRRHL